MTTELRIRRTSEAYEAELAGLGNAALDDMRGRTLRLAVAMRGGVSLAVWIGGAVAELDLLRSIRVWRRDAANPGDLVALVALPDDVALSEPLRDRIEIYASLLAGKAFHRVEVDVLAGASAGGLNSVLLAAAQMAGRSAAGFIETWKTAGGIAELMRSPLEAGPQSLLKGDDYFFVKVRKTLAELYTRSHSGLVAEAVSVDLAATLVDGQDESNPRVAQGEAGFHFSSRAVDPGARIVRAGSPVGPLDASLDRMALAARSTSSFPGAFEPAQIWSVDNGMAPPGASVPGSIDMSGVFSAHRTGPPAGGPSGIEVADYTYQVVDGGVFDNIPVTRAFQAIAPRRSLVPARRVLLYLDPSPPEQKPVPAPAQRKLFGIVEAAVNALGSRQRTETVLDDEAQIERFATEAFVATGRVESFSATLGESTWSAASIEARERAYARFRATHDAALLRVVIQDPETWQLSSAIGSRTRWNLPEPRKRRAWCTAFENRLTAVLNERSGCELAAIAPVTRDWIAADAAATWLLTCVQWMEYTQRDLIARGAGISTLLPFDRSIVAEVRQRCYDIKESAAVAIAERTHSAMTNADGHGSAFVAADAWIEQGQPSPALAEGWGELDAALASLRDLVSGWAGVIPNAPAPIRRAWEESPWRLFQAGDAADLAYAAHVVAPLFASAGFPMGPDTPQYFPVDGRWRWGSSEGALVPPLTRLREEYERATLQAALDAAEQSEEQARGVFDSIAVDPAFVPASAKLAGSRLANFSGFLSTTWRVADWWWGRIDAAARLADVLSDEGGDKSVSRQVAQLTEDQRGVEHPDDPDGLLTSGIGGLARLDPHYRYSVASQLVRVATRALAAARRAGSRVAISVAAFLLRPVLVLVPSAFDPSRLVAAAMFVLAGLVLASSGQAPTPTPLSTVVWSAIGVLVLAWGVTGLIVADRRWGIVASAAGAQADIVARYRSAAFSRAVPLLVGALALLAVAWSAWIAQAQPVAVVFALAGVGTAAVARRRSRTTTPRGLPRLPVDRIVALVVAGAALVVALARLITGVPASEIAWFGGPLPVATELWILGGLGIAGFLLAGDATRRGLSALLVAATAIIAAWAIVEFAPAVPPAVGWVAAVIVWANLLWIGTSLANLVPWFRPVRDDSPRRLRGRPATSVDASGP